MNNFDLQKALNNINISADWIGLREVQETSTYRVIRDGNPESNSINLDHGVMVEVLINGQFGYYGTHKLDYDSILNAAKKACDVAKNASKYSIHSYDDSVRPKAEGIYNSPYQIKDYDLGDLTDLLLKSNNALKGNSKIVTATSMARIVDMNMKYVCSNGSDVNQNFLMVQSDYSAMANKNNIYQKRSNNHCIQVGI